MKRIIITLAAIAAVSTAAPAYAVDLSEAKQIDRHMSRAHVENVVLGERGEFAGMYAGEHHRHLFKRYAGTGDLRGKVLEVEYLGPLCDCGPRVGPYRVLRLQVLS